MKLGEMLLKAGCVTELQLKTALAEQQRWGGKIGKILVDMSYVSEDIVIKALCRQLNIPRAKLDQIQLSAQILDRVDRAFCEANLCVPLVYSNADKTLLVGMADPSNLRALDELRQRTGAKIVPSLEGAKAIAQAIGRVFHAESFDEGENVELKLVSNSGATLIRKVSDIKPPPASLPFPGSSSANAVLGPGPGSASANPVLSSLPPPVSIPAGLPPAVVEGLDRAQKKQTKAIRVLVEMLVERGVFSRDDYLAWLNRRAG